MAQGRQSRLLSYLALAMVIVGALVHALPSSASSPQRGRWYDDVVDASGLGDHGILPSPAQSRELRDQRLARASFDEGADSDTLVAFGASAQAPALGWSFFRFDGERRAAAAPRLAHRPRDPPLSA